MEDCSTLLVSQASPAPNGASSAQVISADGRCVAFLSKASNLVPNDTNGVQDVFVWDSTTDAIERVSVSSTGEQATSPSGDFLGAGSVSISADGRFVAFDSHATNLDPTFPASPNFNVFVRDRQLGTTENVSYAPNGGFNLGAFISADGRFVAFASNRSTGYFLVYVHDRQTGTTVLASQTNAGVPISAECGIFDIGMVGFFNLGLDISADGRFVVFRTDANEVFPPGNLGGGIVMRDLLTATTIPLIGGQYFDSVMSDDAQLVVTRTYTGNSGNLILIDVPTLATTTLTVPPGGGNPTAPPFGPSVSSDARFVAFGTSATNLAMPDENGAVADVIVLDRSTGSFSFASASNAGIQGNGSSGGPSISADGRRVAFSSVATNLVDNGPSTLPGVFLRACVGEPLVVCAGDGSGTPCPCGNSGAAGHGCASSVEANGAVLEALGQASVSSDSLELRCSGSTSGIVLYFQSTAAQNGGLGVPLGDGLLCVGGNNIRLGSMTASGGVSQYPNVGQDAVSVRGQIPLGGGVTRVYQARYRNTASFCTPETFNMSNGLLIEWLP